MRAICCCPCQSTNVAPAHAAGSASGLCSSCCWKPCLISPQTTPSCACLDTLSSSTSFCPQFTPVCVFLLSLARHACIQKAALAAAMHPHAHSDCTLLPQQQCKLHISALVHHRRVAACPDSREQHTRFWCSRGHLERRFGPAPCPAPVSKRHRRKPYHTKATHVDRRRPAEIYQRSRGCSTRLDSSVVGSSQCSSMVSYDAVHAVAHC